MHKVDVNGRNWATEVEWRHHGYVVKINTVLSGGRSVLYDIFGPDDAVVGSARSLREAAEAIEEHQLAAQPAVRLIFIPKCDCDGTGRIDGIGGRDVPCPDCATPATDESDADLH